MRKLVLLSAFIANFFVCQFAFSKNASDFPTHCKSDEYVYLNAKMANVVYPPKGGYNLIKNDKLLSVCVDKKNEPFGRVVYRYGAIGNVEMEKIATSSEKFGIFTRSTSNHTGENIISFSVGKFSYYVTEATGQGTGIGLAVFNSGKQVVDLFSGNDQGVDYEFGLVEIHFEAVSSPVFMKRKPTDKWRY